MANLTTKQAFLNQKNQKSREYWRNREDTQAIIVEQMLNNFDKDVQTLYESMVAECEKEIQSFYQKYAKNQNITIAEAKKRVSSMDVKGYESTAERLVKTGNLTAKAREELKLYNATMKINRLRMLEANIGLHLVNGYSDLERMTGQKLTDETVAEYKRQAGILGNTVQDVETRAKNLVNQSFKNATWNERIWTNQTALRNTLSTELMKGLIGGKSSATIAANIRKQFDVSSMEAKRLARTELVRCQTGAQIDSYKEHGWKEFEFLAYGSRSCEVCRYLNGKHYPIEDAMPAENLPPMHPNCRCRTAPYEDEDEYQRWLDSFGKETSGRSAGNGDNGTETITKFVKQIDFDNKDAIMNLINQTEAHYRNAPQEYDITAVKSGNVYLSKGLSGAVNPQISESREGAYSYHNHPPNSTNFSFSGEDVGDFIANKEAVMCSSDYKYKYKIKRLENTQQLQGEKIRGMFNEYYPQAMDKALKEEIPTAEIEEYIFHNTMVWISEELEFYYERTLQDG